MKKTNEKGVALTAAQIVESDFVDRIGIALGLDAGEMQVVLDLDDLDRAVKRQAGYVAYIFAKEALCRYKLDELTDEIRVENNYLKDLKCQIEAGIRTTGELPGGAKVTEGAVATFVEVHDDVLAQKEKIKGMNEEVNKTRKRHALFLAAKAAIESKEKNLQSACADKRAEMKSMPSSG